MEPVGDQPERQRLYEKTREDLLKRQLSNAENFDKAILSVSTAALGFSLAFLKDFVALEEARYAWLLYTSWGAFALAIVATIASYLVSQWGVTEQLEKAEGYYLRGDESCLKRGFYAQLTDRINGAAGALFIVGVVVTTLFVSLNVKGGSKMAKDTKGVAVGDIQGGAAIPTLQKMSGSETTLAKGAPIPNMQRVGAEEPLGAPIPGLQPMPQAQSQAQQQPSGSGAQGGGPSSSGSSSGEKE